MVSAQCVVQPNGKSCDGGSDEGNAVKGVVNFQQDSEDGPCTVRTFFPFSLFLSQPSSNIQQLYMVMYGAITLSGLYGNPFLFLSFFLSFFNKCIYLTNGLAMIDVPFISFRFVETLFLTAYSPPPSLSLSLLRNIHNRSPGK